ncbi:Protein ENHANCED DISEASE RESISTANCE 2-like [Linum grandiflorum]
MSPTKQKHRSSPSAVSRSTSKVGIPDTDAATTTTSTVPDWISEAINGGSLRHVDLENGTNGWSSPPGNLFSLRSKNYFNKKQKSPAGEYLLTPVGMDWLKSTTKLDNSLKSFVFAVNLQVPDPIPPGSLLHKFLHGDDAYRNQRFKIVNRIVKGPALTCNYHRGPNYLEIDVDIGSSAIATAILHVALGCVTSVKIDMGFVVEAQEEEELPERLIGAVRVCQMEMSSAEVVETEGGSPTVVGRGIGLAKVNHHESGGEEDDDDCKENGNKTKL